MILFHGGCHGCTRQEKEGTDRCFDCCFFEADWSKPDLNNEPLSETEWVRLAVKARRMAKDLNKTDTLS